MKKIIYILIVSLLAGGLMSCEKNDTIIEEIAIVENYEKLGGDPWDSWDWPDVKVEFAPGPSVFFSYPTLATIHFRRGPHGTSGTEIDYDHIYNHPFAFIQWQLSPGPPPGAPYGSPYTGKLYSTLEPWSNEWNYAYPPLESDYIVAQGDLKIRHGVDFEDDYGLAKLKITTNYNELDSTMYKLWFYYMDENGGVDILSRTRITNSVGTQWAATGIPDLDIDYNWPLDSLGYIRIGKFVLTTCHTTGGCPNG